MNIYDIVSLAHNVSFWPQKLTHSVSFWAQKMLKWVSILSGPETGMVIVIANVQFYPLNLLTLLLRICLQVMAFTS